MQYLAKRFLSSCVKTSRYLGIGKKNSGSIILLYHSIGKEDINDYLKLRINPESFEEQMACLYEKKYKVIPLSELINNLSNSNSMPLNTVSITFDDGYLDNI